MLDHGNAQLSSVGAFLPALGGAESLPAFFGGGVGGGASINGAFEIDDNYVRYCYILAGRSLVTGSDTPLSCLAEGATVADGTYIYVKVTHGSDSTTLTVSAGTSVPDNTLDTTYRIIYVYKKNPSGNGGRWIDCRWMPVLVLCD